MMGCSWGLERRCVADARSDGLGVGAGGRQVLGQACLAVGGGVLVQHTLEHGAIDAALGFAHQLLGVVASWSAAATASLTRLRISDRTALLRSCARSFWRFRLIWLLMFATGGSWREGRGDDRVLRQAREG